MSVNSPSRKRRKPLQMTPKPGSSPYSGSSMEDTYLPAMRCPAYRGHDSYPGFRTELENRVGDAKGKVQVEIPRGRKYRRIDQGRTAS